MTQELQLSSNRNSLRPAEGRIFIFTIDESEARFQEMKSIIMTEMKAEKRDIVPFNLDENPLVEYILTARNIELEDADFPVLFLNEHFIGGLNAIKRLQKKKGLLEELWAESSVIDIEEMKELFLESSKRKILTFWPQSPFFPLPTRFNGYSIGSRADLVLSNETAKNWVYRICARQTYYKIFPSNVGTIGPNAGVRISIVIQRKLRVDDPKIKYDMDEFYVKAQYVKKKLVDDWEKMGKGKEDAIKKFFSNTKAIEIPHYFFSKFVYESEIYPRHKHYLWAQMQKQKGDTKKEGDEKEDVVKGKNNSKGKITQKNRSPEGKKHASSLVKEENTGKRRIVVRTAQKKIHKTKKFRKEKNAEGQKSRNKKFIQRGP